MSPVVRAVQIGVLRMAIVLAAFFVATVLTYN